MSYFRSFFIRTISILTALTVGGFFSAPLIEAAPYGSSTYNNCTYGSCATPTPTPTSTPTPTPTPTLTPTPVPTLSIQLGTTDTTGTAPLTIPVTVQAGGTASGTINYTIYCNRSDNGTNIIAGWDHKADGVTDNPYTTSCTYATAGTYILKAIIERDIATPVQAQLQIIVTTAPVAPTATPTPTPTPTPTASSTATPTVTSSPTATPSPTTTPVGGITTASPSTSPTPTSTVTTTATSTPTTELFTASVSTNRAVTLAWNPVNSAASYQIYRSTQYPVSISNDTLIATLNATQGDSYTDQSAPSGQTHIYYLIQALGSSQQVIATRTTDIDLTSSPVSATTTPTPEPEKTTRWPYVVGILLAAGLGGYFLLGRRRSPRLHPG